ncbi:MAG: ankyrin repeat domain-containing protein [Alphaproteobacteria bacterium]
MANLIETFSDAAAQETKDGEKDPVAPVLSRDTAEKDAMTTEAAAIDLSGEEASPLLMTSRILVADHTLSDDAFAAIKRGDAYRLKALLDNGLEVNTQDEQGFTLLMRATQDGATDAVKELLLHNADPEMKSDAGMTALMLAATNGNVDIARLLLDEIEDTDMDTADDVVAEEMALEHGNMSVFFAIQERKRRHEFNKAALDENEHHRSVLKIKKPACDTHGEAHESLMSQILHYAEEKEHKLADTFKRSAAAVGHAGSVVGHAFLDGYRATLQFVSSFFLHKAETATPQETAEMADAAKEVQKTVALIAKALPSKDPNSRV